jgi:hypothetical protein
LVESAPLLTKLIAVELGEASNRKNVIHDIPNLGFSGDQLLRPLFMDDKRRPYAAGF